MAFCRFCGQKNADGAKFCIRCGKPLIVYTPNAPSNEELASTSKEDDGMTPDVSDSSLTNILANGLADIEKEMDEDIEEEDSLKNTENQNAEITGNVPSGASTNQNASMQGMVPNGNPNFQGNQNQVSYENPNFQGNQNQMPNGNPNFQGNQNQVPNGNLNFRSMQNQGQMQYGNLSSAKTATTKEKSHLPYIIIIVILVAVIAAGLILFFLKYKKTDASSSEENTLSSEEVKKIISDKKSESSNDSDSEDSSSSENANDTSDTEASNEDEETAKAPSDTEDSGVHRYELVVEDCTWSEAYQKALDKGGHLVRITSDEEYQAIVNQIMSEGKENIKFYLGGKRDDDSDEYKWVYDVDGNMEYGDGVINKDSQYTNYWYKDEPSYVDKNTQIVENRMMMFYLKSDDKFVFNDSQDDILSSVPYYSGSIGYIVEYQ